MPYCPQCRSEFDEGVLICTDCQVKLACQLPPKESLGYVSWATVQSVPSEIVGNILKGVLEKDGIEVYLRSHDMPSLGGVQGNFSPDWGDILVHPNELATTREILTSYLDSLPSYPVESPDTESDIN